MIFGENGGMTPSLCDGGPEPGRGMSGVAANNPSLSARLSYQFSGSCASGATASDSFWGQLGTLYRE